VGGTEGSSGHVRDGWPDDELDSVSPLMMKEEELGFAPEVPVR
jgi:hypothetical protein